MQLTLTTEETRLLTHHLGQRIEHLDSELVHTDKRDLQRALAADLRALRALCDRIAMSIEPPARFAQRQDGPVDSSATYTK